MSSGFKLALYIMLVIIACVSGYFSVKGFGRVMNKGRPDLTELEQVEPEKKEAPVLEETPATNPPAVEPQSNIVSEVVETNLATVSNALGVITNAIAGSETDVAETNAVAEVETNSASAQAGTARAAAGARASPAPSGKSHMVLWTGLFVVSLVGLGLLIAGDVSHYLGNKTLEVIYNDDGKGVANPDYENAEKVWASGNHLEAISLMREYLNANPREQYVALRIAEIYEKDLKNYLAAALEYEEVLKHKLPAERWSWAAIHLCNLYFKLDQEQKAYALLRRIVKEYPQTPAAQKARKRLEQVDGISAVEEMTEGQVSAEATSAQRQEAPPESASNLPPGFRPKK